MLWRRKQTSTSDQNSGLCGHQGGSNLFCLEITKTFIEGVTSERALKEKEKANSCTFKTMKQCENCKRVLFVFCQLPVSLGVSIHSGVRLTDGTRQEVGREQRLPDPILPGQRPPICWTRACQSPPGTSPACLAKSVQHSVLREEKRREQNRREKERRKEKEENKRW